MKFKHMDHFMQKSGILLLLFSFSLNVAALDPKEDYDFTPAQYGMDYQEVQIPTTDGLTLYGWYFPASSQKSIKCVILSHNGKGNMENMLEIAGDFLSLGYNVLTYDYRGYGKSDDFPISSQFYIYSQFADDTEAAIEYVRKKIDDIRQIDLYGKGIGAGLSIAIGSGQHTHVKNIIADSPYYTMDDIQERYKEEKDTDIKVPIGYDRNTFEPAYAMKASQARRKNYLLIA
ncbi:MAG: alpha/beta hydrolase, partial [Bacteroidales bacterium]